MGLSLVYQEVIRFRGFVRNLMVTSWKGLAEMPRSFAIVCLARPASAAGFRVSGRRGLIPIAAPRRVVGLDDIGFCAGVFESV